MAGQKGDPNLRPEGLAKEEQAPAPDSSPPLRTGALAPVSSPPPDVLSDRKAWPRRNGARFRLRPTSLTEALASVSRPLPDGLADRKAWPKHYFRLRPHVSD